MNLYPTTRIVFDRKKASTNEKEALVQIEVLFHGKKKYISTGVRVKKHQWNPKSHVIGRRDMIECNKQIDTMKSAIDDYISRIAKSETSFNWEIFNGYIHNRNFGRDGEETFPEWVERRINERPDIRESTRKRQLQLINSLYEFGRIVTFNDLTKANIKDYYEWLRNREVRKIQRDGKCVFQKVSAQTAWSHMKTIKTYIREAIDREIITTNPMLGIKIPKGESEPGRWLTEEELAQIEGAEIPKGTYSRVRDLFVFQCYTGISYADLYKFDKSQIEKYGGDEYIVGCRQKTGEEYAVLLLPKAKEILKKYDYELPQYSNAQFDKRLKVVAMLAKIDKPIASHWGRRTFGYLALNKGVRLEVVSRALGHKTTKQTQSTYAKILKKTIVSEMKAML